MQIKHSIIQYTIILKLSLKDMNPYPNILLIQSLHKVHFYIFQIIDLTFFLIQPLLESLFFTVFFLSHFT